MFKKTNLEIAKIEAILAKAYHELKADRFQYEDAVFFKDFRAVFYEDYNCLEFIANTDKKKNKLFIMCSEYSPILQNMEEDIDRAYVLRDKLFYQEFDFELGKNSKEAFEEFKKFVFNEVRRELFSAREALKFKATQLTL